MKKFFLIFLLIINLFAINDNSKIKNLMGEENYQKYQKLIDKIFTNNEYNIVDIVTKLKNNGLIELFFDEAKIVDTKFDFKNGNPILEQKNLNNSLNNLGYYYFYPIEIIKKDNNYKLTLEMKSEHYIDPVALIKELNSRGCEILDVSREKEVFNYKIDCSNSFIKESKELTNENQKFVNPNGIYWLTNSNFSKLDIKTSNLDSWHPSIWFYDRNLNLIDIFRKNIVKHFIDLKIPPACKYIKITDIYSAENFKRGIIIKGISDE